MGLTEEQTEQIRRNRERALEIQNSRKETVVEGSLVEKRSHVMEKNGDAGERECKRRRESLEAISDTKLKEVAQQEGTDILCLEEFEVGASEFVTKKEAIKMYCLPEGTLAVCKVEEKQNPHHKGWTPMKLYNRSEIRRRARERFGGLEGLILERRNREEKRFHKDMERTKDVFRK
jgi:XPA protein C-terminus